MNLHTFFMPASCPKRCYRPRQWGQWASKAQKRLAKMARNVRGFILSFVVGEVIAWEMCNSYRAMEAVL